MALLRSDYDQAARYVAHAIELLEREVFGRATTMRNVLQLAGAEAQPGDHFAGDAAAEITVLRDIANKVPLPAARTEILFPCVPS